MHVYRITRRTQTRTTYLVLAPDEATAKSAGSQDSHSVFVSAPVTEDTVVECLDLGLAVPAPETFGT